MSAESNEANLDRARQAWNAGDLERYLELYDESIRLHGYSPEPMGKAAVREFYSVIFAAFEDVRLEFGDVFSAGDRLCCRFTMTGVHTGEFMGVPATGTPIELPGITVLHFRDGRCIERWSSADMLGLLVQLGAVTAPV